MFEELRELCHIKPKILITGATGQVGHEVLKRLTDDKALDVAASSRALRKEALSRAAV
jgi:uncharacterized protein YbjT (DUF2867 family)